MFVNYDLKEKHPEAFDVYQKMKSESESVLFLFDFASYFNLTISDNSVEKIEILRSGYKNIIKNRVWQYWESWSLSDHPSMGLYFLKDSKWLDVFPELFGLIGISQDPVRHPEGDVFTHTCLSVDQAAKISKRENLSEEDTTLLVFGALCHDIGKQVSLDGHERHGVPVAERFLSSLGAPKDFIEKIKIIVRYHMLDYTFLGKPVTESRITKNFVNQVISKINPVSLLMLSYVHEADTSGRGEVVFSEKISDNFKKILSVAEQNDIKFTYKDFVRLIAEEVLPANLAFKGMHRQIFVENVNKALQDSSLKKEELNTLLGYLFLKVYRDAVLYVDELDYRDTKKLIGYINNNDVDLDSLLLQGKEKIQSILNTPSE